MTKFETYTVKDNSTIRDGMINLKKSGIGLVMIVNKDKQVLGTVSDGDIRKKLIKDSSLEQKITSCMTKNFIRIYNKAEREDVLKLFDSKIKVIPILNSNEELIGIIDSDWTPDEDKYIVRSKAPARISLAGGGTDFTNYFMNKGGVGLTFTIAKYSHVLLSKRDDSKIHIHSHDFKEKLELDSLSSIKYDGNLDLIKSGIKLMRPNFGFDLEVYCDFPPSSGLGGSASILASIIGAFNEFDDKKLDRYSVAENAFAAERIDLGIAGGWQDQYSTVFGGFNIIEFRKENNLVTPLRLDNELLNELEESLIICSTGKSHLGSSIQSSNEKKSKTNEDYGVKLKFIAEEMRQSLLKANLDKFSTLIDETWQIKKENNPMVTNSEIDSAYNIAKKAGASAGRLLGTGGGGYLLFFVPPKSKYSVIESLNRSSFETENIMFDHMGLQSWKVAQ
tara:strand:+ start:41 stop:1387 length:1347 start_codon:yes stop_codon:yes gene_type:complete